MDCFSSPLIRRGVQLLQDHASAVNLTGRLEPVKRLYFLSWQTAPGLSGAEHIFYFALPALSISADTVCDILGNASQFPDISLP